MPTLNLKTLTPVHIGNGEKWYRHIHFVQKQRIIGIVDERKVLDIIGADKIEAWVRNIDEGNEAVYQLLGNRKDDLPAYCHYTLPVSGNASGINELKVQYKTLNRPCIPGTSIKGALRTVLFNDKADAVFTGINQIRKGANEFSSIKLEEAIFGESANHNVMRFFRFGDVICATDVLEVYPVQLLNYYIGNNWDVKRGQHWLAECIKPGTMATLRMDFINDTVNRNRYNAYTIGNKTIGGNYWRNQSFDNLFKQDITGLFALINDFMLRAIEIDSEAIDDPRLSDAYSNIKKEIKRCKLDNRSVVMRIGANSGWNYTTGGWICDIDEHRINDDDLDRILKVCRKGREYDNQNVPMPKTRKFSQAEPISHLFGFIKLSLQ